MRFGPVHVSMRWLVLVGLGACLGLAVGGCRDEDVVTGQYSLTSGGGTIVMQCIGDKAKLVSWQPKAGYTARVIVPGPSREASLIFESTTAKDFRVAVHCIDAHPRLEQFEEDGTA